MNKKAKNLISALCFTLICFVLFSPFLLSGELYPVDFIANIQGGLGKNFRYGAAYTNNASYYKLKMTKKKKAKVLALGTSRVMQFNDFFFTDSFYNAGGGFAASDAAIYFLQQLEPQMYPKYLILGLDEYFFNENYLNIASNESYKSYNEPDIKPFSKIFNLMLEDVKNGKINNLLALPFSFSKFGIMAKVNNQGFENDGSYYYGSVYKNPKPHSERIAPTLDDIKLKQNRYIAGENINAYTIEKLTELCDFAKKANIEIIAFSPPLAPDCFDLIQQSDNFNYINKIDAAVKPVFDKYGFEYYNYIDVNALQLDNSFFIDGFHGSDSAYLAILIDMLNKGSALTRVCNKEDLTQLYNNRINNLQIK